MRHEKAHHKVLKLSSDYYLISIVLLFLFYIHWLLSYEKAHSQLSGEPRNVWGYHFNYFLRHEKVHPQLTGGPRYIWVLISISSCAIKNAHPQLTGGPRNVWVFISITISKHISNCLERQIGWALVFQMMKCKDPNLRIW